MKVRCTGAGLGPGYRRACAVSPGLAKRHDHEWPVAAGMRNSRDTRSIHTRFTGILIASPCSVPAMHVAAETGRVVAGRYYLQDPIGRGAMGTVWRARDALLARDVAVKEVLLREASTPEDTRVRYERTLREARTAARLNHPAVVTIFDVVEADGRPWIVMEFVQARSLEQILAQDGPLPPNQAADVGVRLLGALATAHAAGILHRDVKPSNVLIGADGRAVLTDFGIATRAGDPGLTLTGMVMGTPGFTAPERIRGEPATPASDLWSLGATLYAAVDGHGPFDHHGSSLAVLSVIANLDAPRPRSAGALGPAIDALLRRDPSARPDAATAGRLLAAAAATPGNNGSPGGGYPREAFQDDAFPVKTFQGEAFIGEGFRDGAFQRGAFQDKGFQDKGFQAGGLQDGTFGRDVFQEDVFQEDVPITPQPPAAELPARMSFPPQESPPEGIGPLVGNSPPTLMEEPEYAAAPRPRASLPWRAGLPWRGGLPWRAGLPWRGGLPWRANLARVTGLAALAGTSTETDPPSPGTALLRQAGHSPGRHGARAAGYRRWLPAGLGAVAVVCAGILGGLAIGHSGRSSLPAGYQRYTVPAAETGTAAGFTMAVPSGWHVSTHGLVTDVADPVGHRSIQVDLTPFEAASAFGEASLLEEQAVTDGSFPRYR